MYESMSVCIRHGFHVRQEKRPLVRRGCFSTQCYCFTMQVKVSFAAISHELLSSSKRRSPCCGFAAIGNGYATVTLLFYIPDVVGDVRIACSKRSRTGHYSSASIKRIGFQPTLIGAFGIHLFQHVITRGNRGGLSIRQRAELHRSRLSCLYFHRNDFKLAVRSSTPPTHETS